MKSLKNRKEKRIRGSVQEMHILKNLRKENRVWRGGSLKRKKPYKFPRTEEHEFAD